MPSSFIFLFLVIAGAAEDDVCVSGMSPSCIPEGADDKVLSSSLLQAAASRTHKSPTAPGLDDKTKVWPSDISTWQFNISTLVINVTSSPSSVKKDGSSNLCITMPDGEYLAPEFFLLGAEKAATTSFVVMFQNAGIVFPTNFADPFLAPWPHPKELHIFDLESRWKRGKAFWIHHYPKCQRDARLVATDYTPSYLMDLEAPKRIQSFYGNQSSQVKFGVILRNPIRRMHSAFYFWKRGTGRKLCERADIDVDFKTYATNLITFGSDPCNLLSTSDYATQLEAYFKVFSASQFTIFLFSQVAHPEDDRAVVISDFWNNLGLQADAPPLVSRANSGGHPKLEEDLDANTIAALQVHIERTIDVDDVARVLSASEEKPVLARYTGPDDKDSIATWIQANW